jgi:membrane-associated phospholipid phosphatase
MKRATIISRIFDPYLMLTVLFLCAMYKSTLATTVKIQGTIIGAIIIIVVPIALSIWAIRTKRLVNWDASKREERPKLFLFILVYEFFVLLFLKPILDQMLFQTFATFLVSFAGFLAITLFWKISGHAYVNALVSGFIIRWFGWGWWPVLLAAPLVSWSRVARGNHTILQVVLGACYGWAVVIVGSYFV